MALKHLYYLVLKVYLIITVKKYYYTLNYPHMLIILKQI